MKVLLSVILSFFAVVCFFLSSSSMGDEGMNDELWMVIDTRYDKQTATSKEGWETSFRTSPPTPKKK